MGVNLGFMEYRRRTSQVEEPQKRIRHYNEFHLYLSDEEQEEQAARCMDCGVRYCQYGQEIDQKTVGCPLGNLIPEFNEFLQQGKYEAAYERLAITNNFPEFTSRVCPALCEKACTCSLEGDAVTVHENEFAIIETAFDRGYLKPLRDIPRTGKRIAIVGSGPAALAAATQLNRRGHRVEIFERSDRPGGLLMYGIPNMKLEKQVVMRRIHLMEEEGIIFHTGKNINTKKKADELKKSFDAVLLCCGASAARDMNVEGRDAEGIHFAVDYLTSTTKSLLDHDLKEGTYLSAAGKDVIIVGSGDTANDCLATAVRHGAKSVLQMQRHGRAPSRRRPDNPWPEYPDVYVPGYGQEEAEAVYKREPSLYGATVNRFLKDEEGTLTGVEVIQVASVRDPETGKSSMQPVAGTEQIYPAQMAIIAAGFTGAEAEVIKAFGIESTSRSCAKTGDGSYQTSCEGVFAAGDMHRGASLVVWAIREGREAAREIDAWLNGYTNL